MSHGCMLNTFVTPFINSDREEQSPNVHSDLLISSRLRNFYLVFYSNCGPIPLSLDFLSFLCVRVGH